MILFSPILKTEGKLDKELSIIRTKIMEHRLQIKVLWLGPAKPLAGEWAGRAREATVSNHNRVTDAKGQFTGNANVAGTTLKVMAAFKEIERTTITLHNWGDHVEKFKDMHVVDKLCQLAGGANTSDNVYILSNVTNVIKTNSTYIEDIAEVDTTAFMKMPMDIMWGMTKSFKYNVAERENIDKETRQSAEEFMAIIKGPNDKSSGTICVAAIAHGVSDTSGAELALTKGPDRSGAGRQRAGEQLLRVHATEFIRWSRPPGHHPEVLPMEPHTASSRTAAACR